jgi:hypothetical protein
MSLAEKCMVNPPNVPGEIVANTAGSRAFGFPFQPSREYSTPFLRQRAARQAIPVMSRRQSRHIRRSGAGAANPVYSSPGQSEARRQNTNPKRQRGSALSGALISQFKKTDRTLVEAIRRIFSLAWISVD